MAHVRKRKNSAGEKRLRQKKNRKERLRQAYK